MNTDLIEKESQSHLMTFKTKKSLRSTRTNKKERENSIRHKKLKSGDRSGSKRSSENNKERATKKSMKILIQMMRA
jgi:hypothetical protein